MLGRDIKKAEAAVLELKRERAALESKLLKEFGKQEIHGCKGARGVGRIAEAEYPSIKDRRKFDKYVLKNRAFDLFQNRISSKAYFDRLEEGEEVPGVGIFKRISIRVTKRGSK